MRLLFDNHVEKMDNYYYDFINNFNYPTHTYRWIRITNDEFLDTNRIIYVTHRTNVEMNFFKL